MKNYLSTLFCASVLGAVCTAFAGSGFEKYLRYLASLICILLIISPFRDFELSSRETEDTFSASVSGDTLSDLAASVAEQKICDLIGSSLYAETGISPLSVRIDIDWTAEEPTVTAVYLTLESPAQAETAAAWTEKTYGVPVYTESEQTA